MTGFTPPPRREMPPEVRDRLRRRLWRDLDAPARSRFRAPLAAAVGVAALAAGAVVLTQTVPPVRDALPATTPHSAATSAVDVTRANAELDRCYSAASATGKFPDRPQWKVSFTKEVAGISVTAARVNDKPLFCESTLTSVTISNPDATPAFAAGSATGALFATPNGTIAGVVDPSWHDFEIRAAQDGSFAVAEPEKADGMFVMYTSIAVNAGTRLHAQQLPGNSPERPDDDDPMFPVRTIPAIPAPFVSTIDRPADPADRVSARGQAFEQCLQATDDPVPDRDSWQPGAAATARGSELIMSVNAKGVAACQWQPNTSADLADRTFRPYLQFDREPQSADAAQMPVTTGGDTSLVILGTVRPDVTKMSVVVDGNVELDTDVRSGTFVSVVPDSLLDDSGRLTGSRLAAMTTVLYDAKGNTLYRGPLHPR